MSLIYDKSVWNKGVPGPKSFFYPVALLCLINQWRLLALPQGPTIALETLYGYIDNAKLFDGNAHRVCLYMPHAGLRVTRSEIS